MIMQGPNLFILTNCHGCEFYERKNIFHRCNKLNVPLSTKLIVTKSENEWKTGCSEYEIPACHIDCPFVKQNELAFHDEKSKKLKEELSLKLKTEITSIFTDYWEYQDYLHSKTVGPNLCASFKISHIDFEQLVEFQRNLPDYGLSFSASTQNTIVVSIYKKLEIF